MGPGALRGERLELVGNGDTVAQGGLYFLAVKVFLMKVSASVCAFEGCFFVFVFKPKRLFILACIQFQGSLKQWTRSALESKAGSSALWR